MRQARCWMILVLALTAAAASADDVAVERTLEWRSFVGAHERYREFQPSSGWMDMAEEEVAEFERRTAAVAKAVEDLRRLVERGILDAATLGLIDRAWPREFGVQLAMDSDGSALREYMLAEDRRRIAEALPDLEAHVAKGRYVDWLDRNLFARLREAVRRLDAAGEPGGDTARARAALWEGVFRQRISRLSASPGDEARVAGLVDRLGDESFEVRKEAYDELLSIGEAALPRLLEASRDPDLEVASRARELVESLLPDGVD